MGLCTSDKMGNTKSKIFCTMAAPLLCKKWEVAKVEKPWGRSSKAFFIGA